MTDFVPVAKAPRGSGPRTKRQVRERREAAIRASGREVHRRRRRARDGDETELLRSPPADAYAT